MRCLWTLARSSPEPTDQAFAGRMLLVFFWVVAGVVLATLVVGAVALRRLYQVPRSRQSASPRRLKIPFSTEKIPAGGGCHLAAWFFPASTGQAPGVVLLHGWGQTAESLYPLVAPLHQAGLATLLIDARHHGASDAAGRPSLRQFAEDMTFALDWLAEQTEVDNERLFVLGHSIGGAAALLVGSVDPRIKGVISISSFAHSVTHRFLPAILEGLIAEPLGWLLIRYKQARQGFSFDNVAPVNTILDNAAPVLLVHARDDAAVPLSDARAIYERRRDDRVRLLVLPGGGHYPVRALRKDGDALTGFVDACLRKKI